MLKSPIERLYFLGLTFVTAIFAGIFFAREGIEAAIQAVTVLGFPDEASSIVNGMLAFLFVIICGCIILGYCAEQKNNV